MEPISRRGFLARGSAALGAAALLGGCSDDEKPAVVAQEDEDFDPSDWTSVRAQFELDPEQVHMAAFILASHPRSVRDAIAEHRGGLDRNAQVYINENELRLEEAATNELAKYLGASPIEVALTDSTTMGLGLLYGGVDVGPGDELLATTHDFYSTHEAMELKSTRSGASFRQEPLFDEPVNASVDEIVSKVEGAIRPETRVFGVTWVHSSTGMKLPIPAIAEVVAQANRNRNEDERILLCVDGVHGFGNQDVDVADLGCDFLVSGCHKWMFGPRGTGFMWGKEEAWGRVTPTIPSFTFAEGGPNPGAIHSPGGYHSFEHRWALTQAVEFHQTIGRDRVHERTVELASRLKEGMGEIEGVNLITPLDPELSAGIVCFEVDGLMPAAVIPRLTENNIVASITPYATQYVRMGPSIVTNEEDVDKALAALATF